MVFLKEQTETKNGNEYTNHYFYHGNTYLGKADDGLSQIQANIKEELGETIDPEKIEKLQEEAREKMENEVKDDSDVDYELSDHDYWKRREDLEGVGQKFVWENTEDEGVTVEIEYDGEYFDVLEKHGGFTDNEVATGLESEAEALRLANKRMERIADKQEKGLRDSSQSEMSDSENNWFRRKEYEDDRFPYVWENHVTEETVWVRSSVNGFDVVLGHPDDGGIVTEFIQEEPVRSEDEAKDMAEDWMEDNQEPREFENELSDIEAKPPEIGDDFYHVRVRDPSRYETERVPDWASEVASSVSKGSKVKMGKLSQGDWEVQSVMIKKSNVDRKKAKDLAERIAMKIDNSEGEMSDSVKVVKEPVKSDGSAYRVVERGDKFVVESSPVLQSGVISESWGILGGFPGSGSSRFDNKEDAVSFFEDVVSGEDPLEKLGLSDSGDTDIFAGDDFADKLGNQEWIYGDLDRDDVANIDDRNPFEKGDPEQERVNDEILLSEELKNIEELSENHREVYEMLKDEVDIHKGRVKQPESILKKLRENYSEEVTDIIGVTILAEDKEEVMDIANQLKTDHDLFPIGEERADENHYEDDEFYRAYHLIIEVEHDGEKYPAEVQIKTEEQAKLHGLAHEYYKRNEDMPELLEEKARQLENGEIDSVDVDELKKKLP